MVWLSNWLLSLREIFSIQAQGTRANSLRHSSLAAFENTRVRHYVALGPGFATVSGPGLEHRVYGDRVNVSSFLAGSR
jgi:hypothetical protein